MRPFVRVGMRRDDRGTERTRRIGRHVDAVVDGNELAQSDSDGVGRRGRVAIVESEFETRNHEKVIPFSRSFGLASDLAKVVGVVLRLNALQEALGGRQPGVVTSENMVRDAKHVEASEADKINELSDGERAVAPGGVGVEFCE
jgi:hypothetical protein